MPSGVGSMLSLKDLGARGIWISVTDRGREKDQQGFAALVVLGGKAPRTAAAKLQHQLSSKAFLGEEKAVHAAALKSMIPC